MITMTCGTREEPRETDFLLGSSSEFGFTRYSGREDHVNHKARADSDDNELTRDFGSNYSIERRRRPSFVVLLLCGISCLLALLAWNSRSWQVVKLWRTSRVSLIRGPGLLSSINALVLPSATQSGLNPTDIRAGQADNGESIPLSSDPAPMTPSRIPDNTAFSLPYTKIGVVQAKPGQGSFFYYWFGHDVYRAIRKERVTQHNNRPEEGILSFALHQQQGQPDTFWLYQSLTSEDYFLNEFTSKIFTASNQGRIRNMLKFLVDDAPLLDLELQSPPICSKGMRVDGIGMVGDENVSKSSDKRDNRRDLGVEPAGLLPPGMIYPPNLQPETKPSNNTSPFDVPITANGTIMDLKSHNSNHHKKKNRKSTNTTHTVMMHMTTKPGLGTEFGNWFCGNVFEDLLTTDNTLWNFAMHASSDNPDEFWIYQTFASERAFLKHAESLYLASFPSWWNQDAENVKNDDHTDNTQHLQQEMQRYLAKPVEYVALEPTLMQFGMRTRPPKSKKRRQKHDNSNENHSHTKKRAKKDFAPLHIIHHPP